MHKWRPTDDVSAGVKEQHGWPTQPSALDLQSRDARCAMDGRSEAVGRFIFGSRGPANGSMASGSGEVELEKLTPELHLRLSKKVAQLTKVRAQRLRAAYVSCCPRLLVHRLRPPDRTL